MFPRIARVRHVKDYELELGFSDGTVAQLAFRGRIVGRGGFFLPLENVNHRVQREIERNTGVLSDAALAESREALRAYTTIAATGE